MGAEAHAEVGEAHAEVVEAEAVLDAIVGEYSPTSPADEVGSESPGSGEKGPNTTSEAMGEESSSSSDSSDSSDSS